MKPKPTDRADVFAEFLSTVLRWLDAGHSAELVRTRVVAALVTVLGPSAIPGATTFKKASKLRGIPERTLRAKKAELMMILRSLEHGKEAAFHICNEPEENDLDSYDAATVPLRRL